MKLQPQTAQKIGRKGMKAKAGKLQTGTALDASLKQIKGVSLKPVFPPSEKYAAERARFGLDLSHLPAGSYLLTVNSDKGNATFHFIKK